MTDHLILIDASGLAYRAYHSSSPRYRDDDGEPIGAVEVFIGISWRMLGRAADDPHTHAAAIFDAPGATFRHALFPEYKGGRDPARRQELAKQFPLMRAACELLGMKPMEMAGFEADDVIATMAMKARRAGIRVTIVSSDKDFAQLVEDGHIEIVDVMARRRVREAEVREKFGVAPELVQHVQALAGDSVDNIRGIPGCGVETAAKLVRSVGQVEKILASPAACRFPRIRAFINRHPDDIRRDLVLATLRRDVPLTFKWKSLEKRELMKEEIITFMRKMGSGARVESIFGFDPQLVRMVPKLKSPTSWWRQELLGPSLDKLPDVPQCGYYQRTTIKNGAPVPARIWREPEVNLVTDEETGREFLMCQLGLVRKDPLAEWPRLSMKPITQAQYNEMMKPYHPGKPPPPVEPADLTKIQSIPNPRTKRKTSHV